MRDGDQARGGLCLGTTSIPDRSATAKVARATTSPSGAGGAEICFGIVQVGQGFFASVRAGAAAPGTMHISWTAGALEHPLLRSAWAGARVAISRIESVAKRVR